MAKQRELSGTFDESDLKLKKQISDAKSRELSGHNIFAPSPEIMDMSQEETASRQIRTSVKVSNVC